MAAPLRQLPDDAEFTGVFVYRRDLVYLRGMYRSMDESEVDHAFMLRWSAGAWGQYIIPAATAGHCVVDDPDRTALTLVPDGRVHVARPGGFSWEHVDQTEDGPNSLRHMTTVRPIGDYVYAGGMARMVYRRARGGRWERFDEGMRGARRELSIGGFRSIDGDGAGSIYAVGFMGEIWYYDGMWRQADSPTNVKLETVRCVSPDVVFASGSSGTILVGSRDRWSVVPQDLTDQTFWGMEYFNDSLYLADNTSLYRLEGSELVAVDLEYERATGSLHVADGVLASAGDKTFGLFEGSTWFFPDLPGGA